MIENVRVAIYQNLQELYDRSFDVSNDSSLALHTPIDISDIRVDIRYWVIETVLALLSGNYDRLSLCLDTIETFCNQGLNALGHRVGYNGTTGPMSVNLGIIETIRAAMRFELPIELPTYDKPGYSFSMPYDESNTVSDSVIVRVYRVNFHQSFVEYLLMPESFTVKGFICHVHPWSVLQSYTDDSLPFFMTCETYHQVKG